MVSFAEDFSFEHKGLHVMQAGLCFQVLSLVVFVALCGAFGLRCRKRDERNVTFEELHASKRFRFFLCGELVASLFRSIETKGRANWEARKNQGLSLATIAMLIRCAFRIAELSQGFKGSIWFDEVLYMVFEGAMVSSCVMIMTVCHPGVGFCGRYREADFSLRSPKSGKEALTKQREGVGITT